MSGVAALAGAVAGVALVVCGACAGRIWHEFANPVASQIGSTRAGRQPQLEQPLAWWQEAWHAFTRHPLGGTGAGTFQLTDLALRRSPLTTTEPHNVPLQFLGETGIVGFLLFARRCRSRRGSPAHAGAPAAPSARRSPRSRSALAAFLVHIVADIDWNYVATCGPLLFVAGVLLVRGPHRPAPARRPLLAARAVALRARRRLLARRAVARAAAARVGDDARRRSSARTRTTRSRPPR